MDNQLYQDFLAHHGIKGQKWGVKNGPPYPLESDTKEYAYKNLKKSKTSNLDKWGKDKDHNALYITGYSGSGKSTIANQMAKDTNANKIHLDLYFEKTTKKDRKDQDSEFNAYLDKHLPDWRTIPTAKDRFKPSWWSKIDKMMECSEKFAQEQFGKKKVIIEGIELADGAAYLDNNFFKNKPMIIAQTNALTSILRASMRDEIKISARIKQGKQLMNDYKMFGKKLKELEEITDAKKYEDWVKDYLKTY